MLTRGLSRILTFAAAASLAACGLFDDDDRAPWRAQAEAACYSRGLVQLTSLVREIDSIDGKGACGLDRPLRVSALSDGSVRIGGDRGLTMSCPIAAALEAWVRDVVQPAAWQRYGAPVVELKSMGTYNCRSRNNVAGARLSEHAFANAIDISGFVLSNGYTVSVLKGWRGPETDRAFLKTVHGGACGPFTTVLGPGSDGLHENHLHLDLAHHNAQGTYRYCRPKPEAPPQGSTPMIMVRQDVGQSVAAIPSTVAQPWPPAAPQPMPVPAPQPTRVVSRGPASIEDLLPPEPIPNVPAPAPVANCPPGYVCTPAPAPWTPPPPVGWQVGPQPVGGYGDVTGSLGYTDE